LCGACLKGFSESLGTTACTPTKQCTSGGWFFPLTLLLGSCMGGYFIMADHAGDGLVPVLAYFFQVAGLLFVSGESSTTIKSVLTAWFDLRFTSGGGKGICPIPGLTAVGKEFFNMLTPMAIAIPMIVAAVAQRLSPRRLHSCCSVPRHAARVLGACLCNQRREETHRVHRPLAADRLSMQSRFAVGWLQLAIYAYSAVMKAALALLYCVDIPGADGTYLFTAAADVRCYTGWQYVMFLIAALLFAAPLALGVVTVRWQRHAREASISSQHAHVLSVLASPFHESAAYWSSTLLLQRLLLISLFTFVSPVASREITLLTACVAFLLLHLYARPFKQRSAQRLQTVCSTLLVLITALNLPAASQSTIAVSVDSHAAFAQVTKACDATSTVLLLVPLVLVLLGFGWFKCKDVRRSESAERANFDLSARPNSLSVSLLRSQE